MSCQTNRLAMIFQEKFLIGVFFVTIFLICAGCTNTENNSQVGNTPVPTTSPGISKTPVPTTNEVTSTSIGAGSSSGSTSVSVPKVDLNVEVSGNIVYLYHDGGDSLQKQTTVVRINGQEMPIDAVTFLHSQTWPWSTGKTMRIQYPGPEKPDLIDVLYKNGNTMTLVSQ